MESSDDALVVVALRTDQPNASRRLKVIGLRSGGSMSATLSGRMPTREGS
jgi:hypothetical protein